ncbi:MAG: hypothetical protein HQM11_07590 [SAR324 cluster bacterium]|nr:hypothetical protein [SAR324 cluster bacterium]
MNKGWFIIMAQFVHTSAFAEDMSESQIKEVIPFLQNFTSAISHLEHSGEYGPFLVTIVYLAILFTFIYLFKIPLSYAYRYLTSKDQSADAQATLLRVISQEIDNINEKLIELLTLDDRLQSLSVTSVNHISEKISAKVKDLQAQLERATVDIKRKIDHEFFYLKDKQRVLSQHDVVLLLRLTLRLFGYEVVERCMERKYLLLGTTNRHEAVDGLIHEAEMSALTSLDNIPVRHPEDGELIMLIHLLRKDLDIVVESVKAVINTRYAGIEQHPNQLEVVEDFYKGLHSFIFQTINQFLMTTETKFVGVEEYEKIGQQGR